MPIFTTSVVIFIVYLTYRIRTSNRKQAQLEEAFWNRELEANNVRRQDISKLDYINIPLSIFPLDLGSSSEKELIALSQEKILNLTGVTNTDLKLAYGPANLEDLTQYDENFTRLVKALASYGKELIEANRPVEAKVVLEYAVSIHCDAKSIYASLAQLYVEDDQVDKIQGLMDSARELTTISKDGILTMLATYQPQ